MQPAVDHRGLGLLGHLPVARRDRRVAQQELADLARRDVAAVVDDPRLVHGAQRGVLPGGAERAEGAFAVPPDQPVRRLRHRVAADHPQAEPLLERLLPLTSRGGAGVAEPQVGLGVVGSDRLPHQDLQHRPDRVELGRAVAAGRVEEATGREAGQQDQAGTRRDRAEHGVGGCVDVEQRQRGHQSVLGRQLHPVREADACHRIGAVRLHDELGPAGRARGGDEDRQVVRPDGRSPDRDPATPIALVQSLDQSVDVEHLDRELSACLDDLRPQGRVGDDRPGDDLVDQAGELVEGGSGVGGNRHGTQGSERQPAHDVRRRRASCDDDEVTVADPGVPEPVCEPGHLIGGAAEGQGAFVGAEPRRPGVSVDRGGQQCRDGVGRGHGHRPSLADACGPSNDR